MALLSPGDRSRALLALLIAAAARPARAQEENVYYSPKTTFRIPFQLDPGDRRVRQVILYASEDQGRSYQQAATAEPSAGGFSFRAPRDGWYYFTVQTRDQDGRLYP